ncbi:MAG: SIS domain-containing protein [bacterium]
MKRQHIDKIIAESGRVVAGLSKQSSLIVEIGDGLVACLKGGGTIFTAGNGGSAAEALHMAEELSGRYRSDRRPLPGVCLAADVTALTCIGNDFGFNDIFKRQLEALARPGDAVILFSTSGRSENMIRTLKEAARLGVKTVCLLGRGGGKMAGRGDHEIIVASDVTGRIQEAHQVVMHLLLEIIEEEFGI